MIGPVVRTSWMNLRRDPAALTLSFIVPIVFFSIFASVFGARGSRTPRVTLGIADEDHSDRSTQLVQALRADSALRVLDADNVKKPFDAHSAEAAVRAGNVPVALIIPKGFGTSRIEFGSGNSSRPTFNLFADTSDPIAAQVVAGLLQKTVMTALPEMMMTSGVDSLDRYSGGLTPEQRTTLQANISAFQSMRKQSRSRADSQPIVDIKVVDVHGESKRAPMIALYAAGIGVMFMLFTASHSGGALLEENESGTLDRILGTRVSLRSLLTGKLVYLCSSASPSSS